MKILIDGKEASDVPGAAENPAAALVQVNEQLRKQGRAILTIRVDGEDVAPADLSSVVNQASNDAPTVLEIASEKVSTLVLESIREMEEVLPELGVVCHGLAESFHKKANAETYGQFNQLLEIWHAVRTRQEQILSALDLDPDRISIGDVTLAQHRRATDELWDSVLAAREASDAVRIADILEYELAPRAEAEVSIIKELKSRVDGEAPASE